MATYVVTGAKRGIGYEYCRQLPARGETVIAVCRVASEALQQLGVPIEEGIDITSEASVAALQTRLGETAIDVLINNAGILKRVTLENLDFDSITAFPGERLA